MLEDNKEQIQEHEYCLRCGRKLKNPIARQKGYGAVCEKKLKTYHEMHSLFRAQRSMEQIPEIIE